jgi:hypothetical protein
MMKFKELLLKYGPGFTLGAVTLGSYKIQLLNDKYSNILEQIRMEIIKYSEEQRAEYERWISLQDNKNNTQSVLCDFLRSESADAYQKAVTTNAANPTEYNNAEVERQKQKLDKSYEEIKNLDISETLSSVYNKYSEFLDTLTPDKIVCLFNIIIDSLILSSFISVLSIMLSENIINKISFLEKYPRILKLLKLRNNINKKISKLYLLMHFLTITLGILGNIYMFLL